MKKIFVFLIVLIILGICAFIGAKVWYENNLKPVSSTQNSKVIEIEIKKGSTTEKIADTLEKNKVIKNAMAFKVYLKLNKISNLQAGKYEFENGKDDVKAIIQKLSNGQVMDETVKLTLVEGKGIENYAKLIAQKTNNTEEDVYNLLKDEEYIDSLIEKYWFLTDEIKNEDIYYPLEGYLKADTYVFENKDVSVKYIFNYILNFTDKMLTKYKDQIEDGNLSVHEIITLASIVEKECSIDEYRAGVAGVFFNRLDSNMSLGSDVTTYYAFGKDLAEGDLTKEQINTYNPYNTRGPNMNGKLPVGPICSPREESIEAVLNPDISDYYYFVSDKNEKTYFTKTYADHQKIIQQLKNEGLWFTY
jgi:UPF0755 protein